MPSYFYNDNKKKNWKSFMKKIILATSQTYNLQMHPSLFTGLGSEIQKYVGVKPKWIYKIKIKSLQHKIKTLMKSKCCYRIEKNLNLL